MCIAYNYACLSMPPDFTNAQNRPRGRHGRHAHVLGNEKIKQENKK